MYNVTFQMSYNRRVLCSLRQYLQFIFISYHFNMFMCIYIHIYVYVYVFDAAKKNFMFVHVSVCNGSASLIHYACIRACV